MYPPAFLVDGCAATAPLYVVANVLLPRFIPLAPAKVAPAVRLAWAWAARAAKPEGLDAPRARRIIHARMPGSGGWWYAVGAGIGPPRDRNRRTDWRTDR